MTGGEQRVREKTLHLGWILGFAVLGSIAVFALSGWAIYELLPDWTARSSFGSMFGAVGAFFSALALVGVVAAIVLQRNDLDVQRIDLDQTRRDIEDAKRLSALNFAMGLAPRFEQMHSDDLEAWHVLKMTTGPTIAPLDPEYFDIIEALERYYRSSQFVYQLAVLTEAGTVDLETLYLLYYDDITDHPDTRLQKLTEWLGGGADLAANYEFEDVLRLARPTLRMLEAMGKLHAKRDCSPYTHQLDGIRAVIADIEADPR